MYHAVDAESTNAEDQLGGALVAFNDLSQIAFATRRKLQSDGKLSQQSITLKTYGLEFMHLAEQLSRELLRWGHTDWVDQDDTTIRYTNAYELDIADLSADAVLASTAAYAEQQQRFLETVFNWNVLPAIERVLEDGIMLAASMKTWALNIEATAVARAS